MIEKEIKIVRLKSGEDIIASYIKKSVNNVLLSDPMHVIFKQIPTGQTVMLMLPWLPVDLIKENSAEINTKDVLTIIEPKEKLIKYYQNIVKDVDERMKEEIDLSYLDDSDDDEDEDDDDEITEEEILEVKELKKKSLH